MYIDIAANLTDDMFQGIYHGSRKHEGDMVHVIKRAQEGGCRDMIVLAGTLADAGECLDICMRHAKNGIRLFTTVGFHPTRCQEAFMMLPEGSSDEEYIDLLTDRFFKFIESGDDRVIAIGEFGLDYDRLHFCPADMQRRFFNIQLCVVSRLQEMGIWLPLQLHMRNAFDDFVEIMERRRNVWDKVGGVVHSFTGSKAEMLKLTSIGLSIGLNGCSLKEEHGLFEMVPYIPEDKILLETDSPYCDIRPTHPGWKFLDSVNVPLTRKPEKFVPGEMVKGRNEPCNMSQVAAVVAGVRHTDIHTLSAIVKSNTLRLFKKLAK
jgi:TatD DNase family protein